MLAFEFTVLATICAAALSVVYFTLAVGISPMPSTRLQREQMLCVVAPQLHDNITIHECGAGFGTLAFALADRFPEHRVVAYELSLVPLLWCRLRNGLRPRRNLEIKNQNFLNEAFKNSDVLTCYLFTAGMEQLKAKLLSEKPSVTVISHTFAFRGIAATEESQLNDLYQTKIYVYQFS
jgi:hypothetical protein